MDNGSMVTRYRRDYGLYWLCFEIGLGLLENYRRHLVRTKNVDFVDQKHGEIVNGSISNGGLNENGVYLWH